MALRKCKECGQAVSTLAEACPHCGVPVRRNFSLIVTGCLIVVMLGGLCTCSGLLNGWVTRQQEEPPAFDIQPETPQIEMPEQVDPTATQLEQSPPTQSPPSQDRDAELPEEKPAATDSP